MKDPATRVRQASLMRDEAAVAALAALEEAMYDARISGLLWEQLAAASGMSRHWCKEHVYRWADAHGLLRPRYRVARLPITDYFDASPDPAAPGAKRRHRLV